MVSLTQYVHLHLVLLWALVLVGVVGSTVVADASETNGPPAIIVVVHESVAARDLSMNELRELVLGTRRFWPNGMRVELIVEATPSPGRRAFVQTISEMSDLRFRQYWVGQVFNQRATRSPRAAPNRRLALAMVAAIPGSLTVVEEGPMPPGTRVLTIEGLSPDHPDYPL